MDGQRVNKITVSIDENDLATISLYRTNLKLGEITNDDLKIPSFDESGLPNKMLYSNYCRDLVIHLLDRGGIPGYYYDQKQSVDPANGQTYKTMDKSTFTASARALVKSMVDGLLDIDCTVISNIDNVNVTESYKSGLIKYGETICTTTINNKLIVIGVAIRSGQQCKPKSFIFDGVEHSLNATNLRKIIKD